MNGAGAGALGAAATGAVSGSAPSPAPVAAATSPWRQVDGTPVDCREKLRVLEENHAELVQVMRDAFEDAVLMGVDERRCASTWRRRCAPCARRRRG